LKEGVGTKGFSGGTKELPVVLGATTTTKELPVVLGATTKERISYTEGIPYIESLNPNPD
jgi:hypothetical protein